MKEPDRCRDFQEIKRYLGVEDLARYLGISKWMIYKYVKNRGIPFIPFGRLVRFDRMEIDKWAQKRMVGAAPRSQ